MTKHTCEAVPEVGLEEEDEVGERREHSCHKHDDVNHQLWRKKKEGEMRGQKTTRLYSTGC